MDTSSGGDLGSDPREGLYSYKCWDYHQSGSPLDGHMLLAGCSGLNAGET